jgi:hypothetical protein
MVRLAARLLRVKSFETRIMTCGEIPRRVQTEDTAAIPWTYAMRDGDRAFFETRPLDCYPAQR